MKLSYFGLLTLYENEVGVTGFCVDFLSSVIFNSAIASSGVSINLHSSTLRYLHESRPPREFYSYGHYYEFEVNVVRNNRVSCVLLELLPLRRWYTHLKLLTLVG